MEDVYLTEYVMNMFTYRTYNKDHDGKDIDSGSLKTLSNCSYITGSILMGQKQSMFYGGLEVKNPTWMQLMQLYMEYVFL